jgi:hypothetical protein
MNGLNNRMDDMEARARAACAGSLNAYKRLLPMSIHSTLA